MSLVGPGDRVECINDNWGKIQELIPNRKAPKVGDVVTVDKLEPAYGIKFYVLAGFDHRDIWRPTHFKPVLDTKTDISTFQKMDKKIFGRVDA